MWRNHEPVQQDGLKNKQSLYLVYRCWFESLHPAVAYSQDEHQQRFAYRYETNNQARTRQWGTKFRMGTKTISHQLFAGE